MSNPKKSLASSDGFQLFASLSEAMTEGVPILSIAGRVSKATDEYRKNLLSKKLIKAFDEISTVNPTLLLNAVDNLKAEFGFDYADEVFLNAIVAANSSEMARIPGKVFKAYCEKMISLSTYWSLMNITKILIYPDVRSVLSTEKTHVAELSVDMQQRLQAAGLCHVPGTYGMSVAKWNVGLLDALILCLNGRRDVKHAKFEP